MMHPKGTLRFALYSGYLVALFGFMLWVYTSLTRFDALMRLEVGQSEHLIFAPASEPSPFSVRMAMPAELHPFMIPSTPRRLSRDQDFSTHPLPVALTLSKVEVLHQDPPQDILLMRGANEEKMAVTEGTELSLPNDKTLRIVKLGIWQGLVRSTQGVPCAAVLLTSPEGEEQIVLMENDRWVFPTPRIAMRFELVVQKKKRDKDSGALVTFKSREAPQSWWTILDGESEIRINQLTPGAGAECSDGTLWTVNSVEKDERGREQTLVLRLEKDGKASRVDVPVNGTDPSGRIQFFNTALAETRVELTSSADDEGSVRVTGRGEYVLDEGSVRVSGGGEYALIADVNQAIQLPHGGELRVLQVLAYGLPALDSANPIHEVVLEGEEGRRWYLREGSLEEVAGAKLLYRREIPPPQVRLHLSTTGAESAQKQSFVLSPGDSHRIGTWRFSLAPPIPGDEQGHLLHVRFVAFTPDRLLGIALFIGGAFGLVWIRFRPRIKHDSEGDLDSD